MFSKFKWTLSWFNCSSPDAMGVVYLPKGRRDPGTKGGGTRRWKVKKVVWQLRLGSHSSLLLVTCLVGRLSSFLYPSTSDGSSGSFQRADSFLLFHSIESALPAPKRLSICHTHTHTQWPPLYKVQHNTRLLSMSL